MSETTAIESLIGELAARLRRQSQRVATAESCTGGLIAAAITAQAGSSAWFERGWITYANEAKSEELGVDASLIATHGAVSEPVAAAMARGAYAHSHSDYAVAVTGIAGPDGGSPQKPVGTVVFARAIRGQDEEEALAEERLLDGSSRSTVRHQAALVALELLLP